MQEFMQEYFTEMKRESGFHEKADINNEDLPLLEQVL